MAIHLEYENKIIFNGKNSIWDAIHTNIIDIIEKKNLIVPLPIKNFLEESDQGVYGVGAICPDVDQINTLKDMPFFADLVKQAIEKWFNDVPDLPDSYKQCVLDFHKNLLEIAQTLD